MHRKTILASIAFRAVLLAGGAWAATAARADDSQPFGPKFIVSCTIPPNGDLNPYGIAFVPKDFPSGGKIAPGDVLVANFNNLNNLQGTGVTIIKFTPSAGASSPRSFPRDRRAQRRRFFTSKVTGLTTALGVLRKGFVIVGNLPSTDGTFKTTGWVPPVIDRNGNLVKPLMDPTFSGPWDLTMNDEGATAQLFVSNVLKGTVVRLDLSVGDKQGVAITSKNEIAQGYAHRGDPTAFVLGPTGLAFDAKDQNPLCRVHPGQRHIRGFRRRNEDFARRQGRLFFQDPHLRGPLGMVFAPNGDLITANGDAVNWRRHPPERARRIHEGGQIRRRVERRRRPRRRLRHRGPPGTFYPLILAAVDDVPNVVTVFYVPGVALGSTPVAAQQ